MQVLKTILMAIGAMFSLLFILGVIIGMSSERTPTRPIEVGALSPDQEQQEKPAEVAGVCALAGASPNGAYGSEDLDAISEASRGNEARFDRDYKGRVFFGCMHFDSLEREVFGKGWDLRLKARSTNWMADAICTVDDQAARALVNLVPGDAMHIQGLIGTTSIGIVLLERCTIKIPA